MFLKDDRGRLCGHIMVYQKEVQAMEVYALKAALFHERVDELAHHAAQKLLEPRCIVLSRSCS